MLSVKKIIFWTDGAAALFKNRSTIAVFTFYENIHNAEKAEWNFNESYHGKGFHDGVGGLFKFNVWR